MPPLVSEEVEEIQSDDSGLPDFPSRSVDLLGEEAEVVIEEELEEGVAAFASSLQASPGHSSTCVGRLVGRSPCRVGWF